MLVLAMTLALFLPAFAGAEHAPLPDKLTKARTAYLMNASGDAKAFDRFYAEMKRWGRFRLVASREEAEVVMKVSTVERGTITAGTATKVGGTTTGIATTMPEPYLELRVAERATDEELWLDSTEKWVTSGHAPARLVSNLRERMPASPGASRAPTR